MPFATFAYDAPLYSSSVGNFLLANTLQHIEVYKDSIYIYTALEQVFSIAAILIPLTDQ